MRGVVPAQQLVVVAQVEVVVEQQGPQVRVVMDPVALHVARVVHVRRDEQRREQERRPGLAQAEAALAKDGAEREHGGGRGQPLPGTQTRTEIRPRQVEDRQQDDEEGEGEAAAGQGRNFSERTIPARWSRNRAAVKSVPRP